MKENTVPVPQDPATVFTDTHCHLDMAAYEEDRAEVIRQAREDHVTTLITIGIDLDSSTRAVALTDDFEGVFAAVGIHPHEAATATPETLHQIKQLAKKPRVVGYGEIGLDYAKKYSPVKTQQKACLKQLILADELGLPVIIHDRDAHDDILRLLQAQAPFPAAGVMHCFSGDWAFARNILDLGFYISIPGIVTFKNARKLHEVARKTPLDRLLVETDGPFLAPVPYRGKRNTPSLLLYTAQKIAELRNISLRDIAAATTRNAQTLFRLP
ncbi:MAG: hydrolase TatD [Desulfobulbus propionicus]|nr:MAG: hydrolase TatD [Desulfobulbus propionicus]